MLIISAPFAGAHHAFSAEFDGDAPVELRGKVTRLQWINPHAWIHIAAENGDGETVEWMIEGGTPNALMRSGINRKSLTVGTEIVVQGYQSRDKRCRPACKANGRDMTFPDGPNCSWAHRVLAHQAMVQTRMSRSLPIRPYCL